MYQCLHAVISFIVIGPTYWFVYLLLRVSYHLHNVAPQAKFSTFLGIECIPSGDVEIQDLMWSIMGIPCFDRASLGIQPTNISGSAGLLFLYLQDVLPSFLSTLSALSSRTGYFTLVDFPLYESVVTRCTPLHTQHSGLLPWQCQPLHPQLHYL